MKNLLSVVAAVSILFAPAMGQNAGISNLTTTIKNFDVSNVGPILNELGISWQAASAENGQTYIAANVANVVSFILAPTACRGANGDDCIGLNMIALFEGNPNPQTVRAFNHRFAFASAGINPSGDAYLSRYEIADFGLPRGNLSTSIQVFANQIVMFSSELDSAKRTVALEGYAEDLASNQLNRQVREEFSGVKAHASNPIERHQFGIEESASIVREFIADKAAPRNKIENIGSE